MIINVKNNFKNTFEMKRPKYKLIGLNYFYKMVNLR